MRSTLKCACLILTALSTAVAPAEEWPADELSRTAIAANQETFARVKPCALEMTWKRGDSTPTTAILKYKGTWIFADWERPERIGRSERIRAVLNDAYFAFTPRDSSPIAYQNESDGGRKSTETIARWTSLRLPPNPLTFAFGNGRQTLNEAMDGYLKASACVAQEINDDSGRRVVRMKVYPKKDSGPSDARWAYDFDPARGYAITRLAAMLGLNPFIEYQVELQPGERPGTWLPCHIRRPNPPGNGDPKEIEVRILPGADLSNAAFRIAALNLPPNQVLSRMHPDGVSGSRVYLVDGVWVDEQFAGRVNPAQGTAPKVGAVGSKWPAICAAAVFVAGLTLSIKTGGLVRRVRQRSQGN